MKMKTKIQGIVGAFMLFSGCLSQGKTTEFEQSEADLPLIFQDVGVFQKRVPFADGLDIVTNPNSRDRIFQVRFDSLPVFRILTEFRYSELRLYSPPPPSRSEYASASLAPRFQLRLFHSESEGGREYEEVVPLTPSGNRIELVLSGGISAAFEIVFPLAPRTPANSPCARLVMAA